MKRTITFTVVGVITKFAKNGSMNTELITGFDKLMTDVQQLMARFFFSEVKDNTTLQ